VYSGLFTGQRKVDVLKMLRPLAAATEMPVVAQKTSDRVPVQIHSEYRSIIAAAPVDKGNPNVGLHLRADGVPWPTKDSKLLGVANSTNRKWRCFGSAGWCSMVSAKTL
jgi:hypothetical protein